MYWIGLTHTKMLVGKLPSVSGGPPKSVRSAKQRATNISAQYLHHVRGESENKRHSRFVWSPLWMVGICSFLLKIEESKFIFQYCNSKIGHVTLGLTHPRPKNEGVKHNVCIVSCEFAPKCMVGREEILPRVKNTQDDTTFL